MTQKILWGSLVPFPELCIQLGTSIPNNCGWIASAARHLLHEYPEFNIGILVYSYGSKYEHFRINNIDFYLIPSRSINYSTKAQIKACKQAIDHFSPDLIHIYGTEHSLAEAIVKASVNQDIPIIANIQGLAGPYTRYADGGLSLVEKLINITPLDFYRNTAIIKQKRYFRHRAKCEDYVIKNIPYIIGRTSWDKAHVLTINPDLKYFHLEETLRDSFYESVRWSYEHCIKHSIFVSNSGSPLKGAHQVIKALPIVRKYFPNVMVSLCGRDVMDFSLHNAIHMTGYNLYLRRLIRKLGVTKHVKFLGQLNEVQMRDHFLAANAYVLPSTIENSPNSLAEAQILGVPTISSYNGGTPDMVKNNVTGFLYRYEEYEMLAHKIIEIFNNGNLHLLSDNEREMALNRHDSKKNCRELASIYQFILHK